MKNFILAFSVLLLISACSVDHKCQTYDEVGSEFLSSDSFVELSQAMNNANFVYRNMDGVNYHRREIKDVRLLTDAVFKDVPTRSIDDENPLAYVVNYQNNQGFAILAANENLPPVLVLGDEGCFSLDDYICYVNNCLTRSNNEDLTPQQELQYQLVTNSLNIANKGLVVGPNIPFGTTSDTTLVLKCMPIIPVKWAQNEPYNMYCFDEEDSLYKAGCVPVACAQTLASMRYHHNFRPAVEINSGYPVDWFVINELIYADTMGYGSNSVTPGSRAVATLIRAIGEEVHVNYGKSSSWASREDAVKMYEKIGLTVDSCFQTDSNHLDKLFESIVSKNVPVDCYAIGNKDDGDIIAHCFNVDGWLRLEYSTSRIEFANPVSHLYHEQKRFDLLHVNFGWRGRGDGYYVSGAFDTENREYTEDNDGGDPPIPKCYNKDVCYLTFDAESFGR